MRDGTPAAENPDQVPETVKSTRLKTLQDLLEGQQHAFNDTMQSRIIPVLFEEKPTRNENQIAGRSEYLQIVLCDLPSNINRADIIGTIRNVRITRVNPNSMFGELLI